MKLSSLTHDEQICLVALLKLMVRADHGLSVGEAAELRRAAADLGETNWQAASSEASQRLNTPDEVRRHAGTITRDRARRTIYERIVDAAKPGKIVEEEAAILEWLADLWGLGKAQAS